MERDRGFNQQSSFGEGQQPRPTGEFIIKPNGRIVYPGELFARSEPVPRTSNRKQSNQGQRKGR